MPKNYGLTVSWALLKHGSPINRVCSLVFRIAQTKMFTLELPNSWNFSFNFYLVVVMVMLSYIPVFPQLYLHMFAQRKKVLVNDSKKKAA